MGTSLTRRDFIRLTGLTGAALSLGISVSKAGTEEEIVNLQTSNGTSVELNAWITIDTSGKVTITNHRSEMGQGSWQSVPQIIAEELEVDLNQVNIVFAQGNNARYGSQITGGSSTIRGSYRKLLRLSATAREMLREAFARQMGVPVNECVAEMGKITHKPTGKSRHYGELVVEAAQLQPPAEVKLKPIHEYKILRKPLPRQDTPLKTNGTAGFGLDFKLPGMVYAVVERNPRFAGKVKSFDATETMKVAGVLQVLPVKMSVFATFREGVAVIASNTWAALQGRKVLKVEWDDTGFEHLDSATLYERMRADLSKPGLSYKTKGNVQAALAKSEIKLQAMYETPYESHSCMEPLNCTAWYQGDKLEVWGPIQGPDWVQDFLSPLMNLPKEKIFVNMTFLGGGFGRKAFMDYPHEASVLSKEVGKPVQVIWTREDDMTQGPYRPGMVYACEGSVANGGLTALKVKIAGQDMDHQWPNAQKDSYLSSTTEGLPEPYFNSLPHYEFSNVPLDVPIPVMWWRSVYASTNGFAFESFIDELAGKAKADPIAFRRGLLWENDRYQTLLDKLEEVSGWKSRKPGDGYGVALTECFSSIVGEVVKVSRKKDGKIKVDKVWAVMDCGWYVNPDIIRAQVEGSIIMALGAATHHTSTFKAGMAVERNFNSYPLPRISDTPEIEVYIMDNEEKAGGVGEPGLPPFTPALTNAIFDLTGKRIRNLPFKLADI